MVNPVKIGGVETFSTVDFPDKIAAVVFMQGCPWRCPFCHNAFLQDASAADNFVWEKFVEFLKTRRGILDGVVFSGGEPLMQNGLAAAVAEVKELGFLIGLHTGGYRPKHLAEVLPLVDWIGFDVKAPFEREKYKTAVGGADHLHEAEESLKLLTESGVDFECRTTCDPRMTECRRKKTLLTRKLRRTKEIVRTEQLIQLIAEQDGLREEFDEQLFKMTAEKIVVSKEHDITFCLHNGLKLTERGGGQDAVAHANRL